MKSKNIAAWLLGMAACATLFCTPSLAAESWPTRPVRLIVGFPGGSTPDAAARALAEPLSKALGQPVVVENKVGASGNIAADFVAKANDDHTLGVVINGNLTSAKMLFSKLPYDPARDFTLLALLTTAPLVLVAPATAPGGADFFAAARLGGDKWNFGSVGNGSVGHLGMELLKTQVPGLLALHVPYASNPQIATALLGGQLQLAFLPPGIAMPQVKAGKLKAIGLSSGRSALVPELPPLADAGIRNFTLEVWTALVGPSSLSLAAQARLSQEVSRAVRDPDTRQKLFNQGWQAVGTSPEGLSRRVAEETTTMGAMIKAIGLKVD